MRILTAGRTAPNRAVRFGGAGIGLDDRGRRDVGELADTVGGAALTCGPERFVVDSAEILGDHHVDPGLRSLDVGSWEGLLPEEIPAAEFAAWFGDPAATPHGGECVADFVRRIHAWWGDIADPDRIEFLVVAMPVAQALLCSEPVDYFATEVRPAAIYEFFSRR